VPGRRDRTRVTGPTDRVVVVGAGLAGLSCAMHLAGAGRQVTVLEREPVPGGRAGRWRAGDYRFDTGPTVLTMPDLAAAAFAALGEDLSDHLDLVRLDPCYRAHFPDRSTLDVRASVADTEEEIARLCGPREAAGYRRYVAFVTSLYRHEWASFIDRNLDSPRDLLTPDLARLVAMGAMRRLGPKVASYLKDPRTRRVFSFQALYAGLSPQQALAIYAVISYLDTVAGVYYPRGGMHQLPVAMAAAAAAHGVDLRYRTTVTRVELRGDRAVAVHTADGERVPADVVVLSPDLPVAYRDLLGLQPRRLRRLRYSPSCLLLLAGSTATYAGSAHHNLHFGRAWSEVFRDLAQGRLMRDPSLLVTNPVRTDPTVAAPGRAAYYVLAPTPNLTAPIDWAQERTRYRDEVVRTLEARGYVGFDAAIEVETTTTPLDWGDRGMAQGTPFAAAHTFGQTGPFRPGNRWGENVVLTGSGTQPGVGVPMVLVSGRLAAERITGSR
jgi:phytoene desaturase